MSPADDLFDIIEPENDNSSETENDFVQDENFIESLGFKDMEDDVDAVLDEAVDAAGTVADDVASEIDDITDAVDDAAVDTAENIDDLVDETKNTETITTDDPFGFAKDFVASAKKADRDEESNQDDSTEDDYDEESEEYDESDDEDYDDDEAEEEMMIITEGTMITGSIATDRSLLILGTVNGDISCEGKLTISGTVTGNSFATDVFINDQRTEGNITCSGSVKIGQGSVVIGDITAGAAVIAGAVKGNLDVKGPVILDASAVIKGNIKAKSVQLINGAVLEGFCSLEEYSNSNMDEIFKP